MPVDTTHTQYDAATDRWKRCRDAFDGTDAVKAAGDTYLPILSKQDNAEYDAYKGRALWFGATERTVQALLGFVFRRDPIIEFPDSLKEQLEDVTLTGVPFDAFAKTAVREVLKVGRYGVLVDMAKLEEGREGDDRPYFVACDAERIINWRTERIKGDTVLSLVVLSESVEEIDADDPFVVECDVQYRVLRLMDNVYHVEIWQSQTEVVDGKKAASLVRKEDIIPQLKGKPLDFIPFCFFGPTTITPDIEKPPLLDLVDVNFSHYRTSADLEHGRHFCGLPTPYALGFNSQEGELHIGSATAWISDNHEAKVGMLEFTGQGLNSLKEALAEKKQQMAELGSRILEEPRKGIEAADSIRMRQGAEQSALQSIAASISNGLTSVLRWHAMWAGADTATVSVKLNQDFVDAEMNPQEFTALMAALQAGLLSFETFYWNLQKSEIARPGIDVETELAAIDADEERFRLAEPTPEDNPDNPDNPPQDDNAGNE
jgi:hypothetical protein